jgi:amidophosphoribosyltransferase
MSDAIQHECGLAYIRLRKPLSYYQQQYGTALYGINKLYLLMEKQHNRGQDGAGVAVVKLNTEPGYPFMYRQRSVATQSIGELFQNMGKELSELEKHQPDIRKHPGLLKGHLPFVGELLMGHLRYGTQGKNNVEFCHPFIKKDIIPARNISLAGNFNLVNTEELFSLVNVTPADLQKNSDLAAMLEVVHHYQIKEDEKNPTTLNVVDLLKNSFQHFDGGYHVCGLIGNGDSFLIRDPHAIRPAYYYITDELIVAASERAAIRTAFNVGENEVIELPAGHALIIYNNGSYAIEKILEPKERKACSFERIYFSRGSDEKIYRERIALGQHLSDYVLKAINYDLKNTIFSFIPNTAEIAFYGLLKGMEDYLNKIKIQRILSWGKDYDDEKLSEMINRRIRIEKIAIKDVKMRTFITEDANRAEMVQHVYDITYGTVRNGEDTLVMIDDSIVRGTTLKESIIQMLGRLNPKKIIIISSAPQIRYPDCYGIDMSKMGDFIAFRAVIELIKDNQKENILDDVYNQCVKLQKNNQLHTENLVKNIYNQFTTLEISAKVAQLITPEKFEVPVEVIFQTVEDLHQSCPTNTGDWYFTGDYPTPGGNMVVNRSFMNYMEGKNVRGY